MPKKKVEEKKKWRLHPVLMIIGIVAILLLLNFLTTREDCLETGDCVCLNEIDDCKKHYQLVSNAATHELSCCDFREGGDCVWVICQKIPSEELWEKCYNECRGLN